jgi:serine protease Do
MRFARFWSLFLCLCSAGYTGSAALAQTSSESSSGGYLGVAIVPVDDNIAASLGMTEARGVFVYDVQDGSPAAKAGLKPRDVVLQFDGVDLVASANLGKLVNQAHPGHKASLTVLRHGKVLHLSAVLAARQSIAYAEPVSHIDLPPPGFLMPDMPSPALRWNSQRIGIEYEGVDSQLAEFFGVKQGVLIRFVLPHSIAQRAGLKAGDVLVKFNGKDVAAARDLAVSLQQPATLPKNVALEVVRDRKQRSLVLPLGPDSGFEK